jgi:Phosphotransferase enzyme family.
MNYGSQINVEKQARYEFNALKILYRSRHTPEPLYLDDSKEFFDHDILIEKFLPGRPLIYHEDLNKAAEIFASIHNLKLSKDEISYLKVEKNICSDRLKEATQLFTSITDSDKLNSDQKNILFSLKSWCEKNVNDEYFAKQDQCLVNTEVNSNNFLITPDYGWLIDWEKPVYSNAVQDLTQFMAKTTTLWRTTEVLSEQQIDQFLNKYAELTEQSVDQLTTNINLYMPFLLLRALSWCGMLIATYDQKPIQNEEILHRCEDFLQLDFAIPLLSKYGVIL